MRAGLTLFLILWSGQALAVPVVSELDSNAAAALSVTTASISITGMAVVFVDTHLLSTNTATASVSGCGLTWSTVATSATFTALLGYHSYLYLLEGTGTSTCTGGSLGTLTITVTPTAGSGRLAYDVLNVTGYNTSTPVAQSIATSSSYSGKSPSLSLTSPAATSATVGGFATGSNLTAISAGAGYTGSTNAQTGTAQTNYCNLRTEWQNTGVSTVDASSTSSGNWGVIAVEIPQSGPVSTSVLGGKSTIGGNSTIQ
ncbi:MAG: hypothetical protein HQL14_07080 [Candidatus Omnitrophica bacterium]|nr:hypothetical protein [Candidatus Omnitrophota bacterium]